MLVVVDEFSRECLAIQVARGLTSDDVLAVLAELFVEKGVPPEHIRSGNGPEFVAAAVRAWLARPARRRDLVHRARQPGGEWLLRVVQRQAPGRAAGSGGLPQLTGGAGPDRCKAKPWTGGGTTTPSVRTRRSATDHRRPRRCRGRRSGHPARPLATAPMSCIANAAPGPARRGRSLPSSCRWWSRRTARTRPRPRAGWRSCSARSSSGLAPMWTPVRVTQIWPLSSPGPRPTAGGSGLS